jgi:hypothetical protein
MFALRSLKLICIPLFLLLAVSLAGCNEIKLSSNWCDREIAIDGDQADWAGKLRFLEDQQASVGVLNDGDFLYLCLVSSKEGPVMQTVRSGFTVWLDSEGGKKKNFGVKFPLGMQGEPVPMMDRSKPREPEMPKEFLDASLKEIEIIGPGEGQVQRAEGFEEQGIEVKIVETRGKFVYELKVPLAMTADHPYAIGVKEGKPVGIGLEAGEPNRPEMGDRPPGGGFPGGGAGGGPGGGPGGGGPPGGGGRGSRPEMSEPIKLWLKVSLASAASSD